MSHEKEDVLDRRGRFALDVVECAKRHELEAPDVADSFTTMLVGIYKATGLTEADLHERVRVAWAEAASWNPRGVLS